MKTEKHEVMGQIVKAGQELVSLTDLWKAANGDDDQKPNQWLRLSNTAVFITTCGEKVGIPHLLFPPRPLRYRRTTKAIRKWGDKVLAVCEEVGLIQRIKGRNGGVYAHWQIALSYAQWLSPELHMQINDLFRRFQEADPSIAESVIERTDPNSDDFKRLQARMKNIETNKELNAAVIDHGGTGRTCAYGANKNNVAITGFTAKQIRKKHKLPAYASTRPLLDTGQMVEMAFLERLEALSINSKKPEGHTEILNIYDEAIISVKDVIARHTNPQLA